ncbi:MAG TPA: hypothetical protein VKC34_04490 [Blastocatellia bacterium]|nr:hypothetical protein [Blastocatellia bacterium]
MTRPKFCPGCGERLTAKRSFLRAPRACDNCASRLRRSGLLPACALISGLLASFATGHFTAERRPFYFIGAQVDPRGGGAVPLERPDRAGASGEPASMPQAASSAGAALEAPCGARTRSGRPCKRKVRGGGRCWQHRSG